MRWLGLALVWGAMSAASAATIRIVGDPPLPAKNEVVNADVEAGEGEAPLGWRFGTAMPENFEAAWRDGGRSGKCLWLKAKTGAMSGYWGQSVPVQPGRTYLFKGYYRLGAGKILCYAHGRMPLPDGRSVGVDERFYRGTMRGHWLVPVFLPPDALGGPDPQAWYPFRLKVSVPEPLNRLSLSLGLYFTPGEAAFDDLWLGLAETDLSVSVEAGPGETIRRVVVRPVGSEAPLFDSQDLSAGTQTFQTVLKRQATDAIYEVLVTLGSGKVVTARYPADEEGAR